MSAVSAVSAVSLLWGTLHHLVRQGCSRGPLKKAIRELVEDAGRFFRDGHGDLQDTDAHPRAELIAGYRLHFGESALI